MTEALRRLVATAYLVALFFVLMALIDIATNIWPFDLGNEQWRYASVAVGVNYLLSILFGGLLAALVAAATGHRAVLRLLGLLAIVGVIVLVLVTLSLVLDTLQLRSLVRAEESDAFRIGTTKAAGKLAASIVGWIVLARGCFTAAKTMETLPERDAAPLVR